MTASVHEIARASATNPAAVDRPTIHIEDGSLPENIDALAAALARAPDLFAFGVNGELFVHLHPGTDHATMIEVSTAHLVELAGIHANILKYDGRIKDSRPADCPRRHAEAFLDRRHWPEQKRLLGVLSAPIVTTDGRLIAARGYDSQSGLFLSRDPATLPGYVQVAQKPSISEAKAALDELRDAFRTWPFVGEADLSAAVAALLSAILRRAVDAAPMVAIAATAAGSGKSLLADFIGVIATGSKIPVMSLAAKEDETEKRIHAALLAGDQNLLIDNVSVPLGLDVLCQTVTQSFSRIRPLGGSGLVTVPNTVQIFATGNALTILGDLKRRTLLIRLDAGVEQPELRKFERNAIEFAQEHRGRLISAALTVVLGYIAAGRPSIDLPPFGSFEQWDALVRRPLAWLGMDDPLSPAAGLRAIDPEVEVARLLLNSWTTAFGTRPVTAATVVTASMQQGPASGDYLNPDLREALQIICIEKPTARRLGGWLRANRGRITEGLKVDQAGQDGHSKTSLWKVEPCG